MFLSICCVCSRRKSEKSIPKPPRYKRTLQPLVPIPNALMFRKTCVTEPLISSNEKLIFPMVARPASGCIFCDVDEVFFTVSVSVPKGKFGMSLCEEK